MTCLTFAPDMDEKLKQIIVQSTQLFMKFGIRSLTMDDVAKNLRISKKTLYQYVSDKDDLVNKCIEAGCTQDECGIKNLTKDIENSIDEFLAISEFVTGRLNNIHPSIFFDLEKYHPEAMGRLDRHRKGYILETIKKNLETGIKQGFYRNDLKIDIISQLYLISVEQLLHETDLTRINFSLTEIYLELVNYHLHGILSEKGLSYLNNLTPKQHN